MLSVDSEPSVVSIQKSLIEVQEKISVACRNSHRNPNSVAIIAVTKTFPSEVNSKAYAAGLRHIGENRVQQIVDKFADGTQFWNCPDLCLHLIGHLQSNKVRKAVSLCHSIDSVDSLELAEAINNDAGLLDRKPRILIEVNTSGEAQKFGIIPSFAIALAEKILPLTHIELAGLMTVGPLSPNPDAIRRSFIKLREIFEEIQGKLNPPGWSVLSMGMSGDYEMAVAEGATEIRLGTALFGARRNV
jgi:PLP dependent protein